MRAIPLSYVMRNLWVRRVTTALTAGGMALVGASVPVAPGDRVS